MSFLQWQPRERPPEHQRSQVTVLSGFLGAGKTTLLNHLLKHAHGQRLAVLVNDLGEVNIDASLIRSEVEKLPGPIGDVLELTSGCICCSIQTELMDALLSLYERYQPEHIIIEATGVAEPKSILETLYAGNYHGYHGTDFMRVANMVTVIDAANLEQYLSPPPAKRTHLLSADPRKPLQELLMEQIECADVLVLNKAECLNDYDRDRLSVYLKKLNAQAEVWEASFGQINTDDLLLEARFSETRTLTGALWRQAMLSNQEARQMPSEPAHETDDSAPSLGHVEDRHANDSHKHENAHEDSHTPDVPAACDADTACACGHDHDHHDHAHHHDDFHHNYGLETFVFNARHPFNEARLFKTLRNGLPGVIRAKGFYWVDRCPERVGLLSIAGKILRTEFLGEWWHTQVAQGRAPANEIPEAVRDVWLPEYGDRRQEIVLIGIDMDRNAIVQALTACFCEQQNEAFHQ